MPPARMKTCHSAMDRNEGWHLGIRMAAPNWACRLGESVRLSPCNNMCRRMYLAPFMDSCHVCLGRNTSKYMLCMFTYVSMRAYVCYFNFLDTHAVKLQLHRRTGELIYSLCWMIFAHTDVQFLAFASVHIVSTPDAGTNGPHSMWSEHCAGPNCSVRFKSPSATISS